MAQPAKAQQTEEEKKKAATARKAAKTRKANAEAKAAAEEEKKKKAAKTRKANKKKKEEEEEAKKKAAAKKKKAGGAARNPKVLAGFLGAVKGAAKMGGLLLPILAASNWLANRETKKDGQVTTWGQRVGPLFHVGLSAAALAIIPRYVFKGGTLGKWKPFVTTALQALLVFNVFRLVAFLGRRKWSFSEDAIPANAENYPTWTNLIELQAPLPALKAPEEAPAETPAAETPAGQGGVPYHGADGRLHTQDALGHPAGGNYGEAGMGYGPGQAPGVGAPIEMWWDDDMAEFVPVPVAA